MSSPSSPPGAPVRVWFIALCLLLLFLLGGGGVVVWQRLRPPVPIANPETTGTGQQSQPPAPPADPSLVVTLPGGFHFTGKRWLPDYQVPAGKDSGSGKDKFLAERDLLMDEEDRIWMMEYGNPAARLSLDRISLERLIRYLLKDENAKLIGPIGVALDDPTLPTSMIPSGRGGSFKNPKNPDEERAIGSWEQYSFFAVESAAGTVRVLLNLESQGVFPGAYVRSEYMAKVTVTTRYARNINGAGCGIGLSILEPTPFNQRKPRGLHFGLALPWMHGCPWADTDLHPIYGRVPLDRFLQATQFDPKHPDIIEQAFRASVDYDLDREKKLQKRIEDFTRLNFPETNELPLEIWDESKGLWYQRWLADLPRPPWALKKWTRR